MYHRQLRALLGIPEDATELQMHQLIVAGLPVVRLMGLCEQGVFRRACATGLSRQVGSRGACVRSSA